MALDAKLLALVQAIGGDVKALRAADGNLTNLPTTTKSNLVGAVAEVYALIGSSIAALRDELRSGAGPALDTFKEVQDALLADESAAAALATAVTNRVRFDAAQTLTGPQAVQARSNIGAASAVAVGDTEQDLVVAYNAAKA